MQSKKVLLMLSFMLLNFALFSQQGLFRTYKDSASLVQDANTLTTHFINTVNAIRPVFTQQPTAILNTKPFLIFYSSKTNLVNLPIWHQVMLAQKDFFYKLSGSKEKGREVFGLFFNGFYLPHELGHALQSTVKKKDSSLYANEYFANVVALLYWKGVHRTKELELCYQYAKKFVSQLRNPVPQGEDAIKYFDSHYNELGADPYKYAYFQFRQFIQIYEDESLGTFEDFIKSYLAG